MKRSCAFCIAAACAGLELAPGGAEIAGADLGEGAVERDLDAEEAELARRLDLGALEQPAGVVEVAEVHVAGRRG